MLTPLSRPVAVSLDDPSEGPVLAHSSTVLPCPAAPLGLLSGLHLPSFSTNLVSGADLHDAWVDQFTPGGQRVTHCTCSWTGRHLATFTRRPGSGLYTLTTAPPPVPASGQVATSSQVFAAASRSSPASTPSSYHPLAHETLLWHHRLGHPSLPRLRGMASRALVSGLLRSFPPLPPGPGPTCVPCVEGQQRAAPHSSFPPTEAPLQTLHMDVWGPACVRGQGHERYFLLVVDDYSRYTRVFPCAARVRSLRGGEFSSDLLRAFCRSEGIRQMFTLPASPQQNGIAKRHIGKVMDVARTSMIHAAAPHFLWPFAGPAPSGVSYVDCAEPVEVAVDSGAESGGAEPAGVGTGGAESRRAVPGGAEPGRVEPVGAVSGGAEPACAASGGALGVPPRREPLSPQQLRELYSRRCRGAGGATGGPAGASRGAAGAGAAGGAAGAGGVAGASEGAAGAGAARGAAGASGGAPGAGAAEGAAGAGGAGGAAGGAAGASGGAPGTGAAGDAAGTGDPRAEGTSSVSAVSGGAAQPRPYYVPLLQQFLGSPPSPGPPPPLLSPPPHVPLPSPPTSSLPAGPDPKSDSLHAARPDVTCFPATAVSDPLFESTAPSALVSELVDFAAACRLDYAARLVSESASVSVCPPSVG
ncbi:unnamed protein product, partial [Closterium sp. NIES-54]